MLFHVTGTAKEAWGSHVWHRCIWISNRWTAWSGKGVQGTIADNEPSFMICTYIL